MQNITAMSIGIGLLGALATYLTATVLLLPVWVIFIAWASFFAAGGGIGGLTKSIASNLTGVAIASLSLLAATSLGGTPIAAAICVGLGSAAMVQFGRIAILSFTPCIVFGFASLVGTSAALGLPITHSGIDNPAFVAAAAVVVGGIFGIAHESLSSFLMKKRVASVTE
ncbi:membrane protein [Marinobacter psychrophilus]|jgi:hypothetical protein|uniref:Membrane protein n=1 Tax=Marinobacter psychrophilus TaxID=330734 RepID=A0A0H4I097_9GAMM|nr:DUF1097 domain-containing protein [Marinobacter psychrophilus]AKO52364.1 membrane protein [Marinobacter psychrophilus]